MQQKFLQQAHADLPVYLTDVYRDFQKTGTRPFHLRLTLYDGTARSFPLQLPPADCTEEAAFLAEYIHAFLYNLLSSLGARAVDLYFDPTDQALQALVATLPEVFQLHTPRLQRTGYGKCLNVNDRILTALLPDAEGFSFRTHPLCDEPEAQSLPVCTGASVLSRLPARATHAMLLGIDVGGTDIKLCASVNGDLCVFKEFDWFPAAFTQADQLTEPIVFLTRLLRAAASLAACGKQERIVQEALDKHADRAGMEAALAQMEAAAGQELRSFDAIGLSFPDVVIDNRIVGGETYKTRGMRNNPALDYETEFAKVGRLRELLAAYTGSENRVLLTNDGPMAAFTEAVEQAAAGADTSRGFFAHTLGTELGTGWVRADGSIPQIPLEVYNFIIDLGSYRQRQFDADDARSVLNFNTNLPGTLQKYPCQSGVFRLAAKYLPQQEPDLWAEAMARGLFRWQGEKLLVPTEPQDMRKPCLEFFMEKAAAGSPACQEIFRQIGEHMAVTWEQTELLLHPGVQSRTLFGRLVKNEVCFRLLCEGAHRREPQLVQHAANDALANTALMQQLAAHPIYTVAQFAQAVGAIYYACLSL